MAFALTRRRVVALSVMLAGGVWSCGVLRHLPVRPGLAGVTVRTAVADHPHGPSAVDVVEQRLLRYQTGLAPVEVRAVARSITTEADRNGLPWEMILAVIHIESGYHNFARSSAGALGLMQLMPFTAKQIAPQVGVEWAGPRTLFDPVANVRMGTAYLAALYRKYGRSDRALAAYNWGPGAIDRRLRRGSALPVRYAKSVRAVQSSLVR